MKLRKKMPENYSIINVSPEVYNIFETTGFSEILDIKKKLRTISIEGCKLLGQGGNGSVYQLDDDTIVKVYKPWMTFDEIERERTFAKTAFINGVPSVIAFDTVKCGDCYGVVFEMLKSDTLGHAIANNPEKMMEYVDKYVELAKTLHSTHIKDGGFLDIHEVLKGRLPKMEKWFNADELALLERIIDSIPYSDTLVHNDLHPGNIMIQDGELILIDMPEVTLGPPICDMAGIFRDLISAPKSRGSVIERSVGMPAEMITKVGQLFFAKYTGITSPEEMEGYFKKLGLIYAFNVVMVLGTGSENAVKSAEVIKENLFKGVVEPNEQTICQLFKVM
jgi:uncharacterized protein (TIGR02172 family)